MLTFCTSTGASRIFIFDHTIRRESADPSARTEQKLRGPVQRVHIDQSYAASLTRVTHHLPDEAEKLLQGRVHIINVWRPIKTVERDPLAVADANSVDDRDLVVMPLIYPHRRGETYAIGYDPGHRYVRFLFLSFFSLLNYTLHLGMRSANAKQVVLQIEPHTR
jgi:hypothetical protein